MKNLSKNTSKEISSRHDSSEIFDHTLGDNGIDLVHIEEEAYVTSKYFRIETNHISMNLGDNYIHKYFAQFLSIKNNEDASPGSKYY